MLRILTRLHVVPGAFVGTHLKRLCHYKRELLVSMRNILTTLIPDVVNQPVDILLRAFNSLSFRSFTNLDLNSTVSIERRRLWTKPPCRLLRCGDYVLSSSSPLVRIWKIVILEDKTSFIINNNESRVLRHTDFGFAPSTNDFVEFLKKCDESCKKFKLFFRRVESAKTSTTIVFPRTSVRREFRDPLFNAATHLSKMRHVGLSLLHVDVHDLAAMRDPSLRNFEFLERFQREDARDALLEVYTQRELFVEKPRYRDGDRVPLLCLAKRDGAQCLVHIRRMLFKMLTVVGKQS